jgi:hypothetical protein
VNATTCQEAEACGASEKSDAGTGNEDTGGGTNECSSDGEPGYREAFSYGGECYSCSVDEVYDAASVDGTGTITRIESSDLDILGFSGELVSDSPTPTLEISSKKEAGSGSFPTGTFDLSNSSNDINVALSIEDGRDISEGYGAVSGTLQINSTIDNFSGSVSNVVLQPNVSPWQSNCPGPTIESATFSGPIDDQR